MNRPLSIVVAGLLAAAAAGDWSASARQPTDGPLFVESAAQAGLRFTHVSGATGQYYMAEQMGAGVALFDYDNDGDLDVFFVQGGALGTGATSTNSPGDAFRLKAEATERRTRDPAIPRAPEPPTSRLFRSDLVVGANGTRTLRFTDVTERAGLGWREYGMGAAVGDYDNDGDLDLFVTSFGPDALFRNNGDGTFTDVTAEAGTSDPLWSTSAAFLDYDRDGDLDLFVANYLDFSLADNKVCTDAVGARDYCTPRAYRPLPDRLYRNEGNGRFRDVSADAGVQQAYGAGLGVTVGDYNRDGWLDLYVANDATPNQLWINQQDGTFLDDGPISGSAVNAAGNPEGSMGIASGDVDNDGDEDIFITNIIGETFVLYENDGSGSFEDARVRWGLSGPTAAFTGFGADWLDYDNDGWLDLFVTNGAVNVIERLRGEANPFRMRNQLFRNTGQGRFVETSSAAGPAFTHENVGRGAAFGDVDNDGDVDIVITTNNGPASLLLNQAAGRAHWVQFRLQQPGANRFGLGAWVSVERAGEPTLSRRVKADGSYLSASDLRAHFGLGASPAIDRVLVHWPDGAREAWTAVTADRVVTLHRDGGTAVAERAQQQ